MHQLWKIVFIARFLTLTSAVHATVDRMNLRESTLLHGETPDSTSDSVQSLIPSGLSAWQFLKESVSEQSPSTNPRNTSEVSNACLRDVKGVIQAYEQREEWAVRMYDAMGKVGAGVLHRQMRYWGDYLECVAIDSKESFHPVYCKANAMIMKSDPFDWKKPQWMEFGLCVPSTCDNSSVRDMMNLYFLRDPKWTAMALTTQCQTKDMSFTAGDVAAIVLCVTMAVLVLLGTAYDVLGTMGSRHLTQHFERKSDQGEWTQEDPAQGVSDQDPILVMARKKRHFPMKDTRTVGTAGQFLLSFSVIQNGAKLLSTFSHQEELQCVNGLRVVSMACIIWGHTITNEIKALANGMEDMLDKRKQTAFETGLMFDCVDTFFVLSGLLVVYSIMPRLKAKGVKPRFIGSLYLLRYLRLTPTYFLVLFTYTQLFRYIGSGPLWPQEGLDNGRCDQFPWNNLLYINNFVSIGPFCMNWSWYLAVDMQFFVIFPLIVLPFYYFDWKGVIVPVVLTVISIVTAGVISYQYNIVPCVDPLLGTKKLDDYMYLYYYKPYTRYGPYAAGMVLGFVLERYRCQARLTKKVVVLGWSLCLLIFVLTPLCTYLHIAYWPMSNEVAAIYNAVQKPLWGVAVCWVIFACSTGYGGPVNTILSWKVLGPCGRVTFVVYLLHLLIINAYILSLQDPVYVQARGPAVCRYLGFLFLAYLLGFVVSLTFEAPFISLIKLVRQRSSRRVHTVGESRL